MYTIGLYTRQQAIIIILIAAFVSLAVAVGIGFACRAIVRGKGYPDALNHGFAWGFWLGLIGLIVCAAKQNFNPAGFPGGQPYNGQPYNGQPYNYNGQPYGGQPYGGQPYGQSFDGQSYGGQPYGAQPNPGDWQCSCGAVNSSFDNTCRSCGAPRMNGF